ncbi:hypothetical protein GOP47_0013345 [Adiantum capillus-veneris]|uniref:Uncharacterized protein n=1 Tax=Adiantum capillus-veneris TaxID=13818 RepID=A0A9D4ZDB9_ADICA|nr:hypothetical protein GOP47_0013345 [Adiantum capillus-veneris]
MLLNACADELKKLTRVANLANLVKLQRDANQQSYVKDLEKYSTIYRALGKHNPTGQNVNAHQKALAAEECSCSIQEVDKALEFYERMKEVASKMKQMQEKGEAIPKTMEEMSKLINNTFAEHKVPQRHSTGVAEHKVPQSYCTVAAERKHVRPTIYLPLVSKLIPDWKGFDHDGPHVFTTSPPTIEELSTNSILVVAIKLVY